MANLSVQLSAQVVVNDTSGANPVSLLTQSLNNPTYAATTWSGTEYIQASATGTSVTLAGGTVYVIIVINKASSGINLEVTLTPAGGTQAIAGSIAPGGVFCVVNPTTGTGYTSLTLTSSSGTCPAVVMTAA